MNNIDQLKPSVKTKITTVKKAHVITVAQVFEDFHAEGFFTPDLASKPYDASHKLLSEITRTLAVVAAKEAASGTGAPTASYITKKQKAFATSWWTYLTEKIVGGPDAKDKSLKRAIELDVRQTFDAVLYKTTTGKDLPESKDGFGHNAMQALRKATGHGDAAIFLYRLRYWWPKAKIVIDGRKWIANTHKQWAEELGIEERGFRTAYSHLLKMELIEARAAPFKGQTMNHVRPTEICQKLFASSEQEVTD
ncbi:hypothetical protein O9X99_09405 [Agrobacterium salinitolerans]|uniref:Uncharacterized protein n=1 Tax=Agrobacterium salinitolerans TaxID=1183413 RepID=A0ABY3BRP0_9HYPH|nr:MULTISPECIES: hypothetical protein [Agrobacterium]MCZ7891889.1 hypothetical protein [Agrobacterium salinitolerans]TRA94058.1 hypothetical protein EXN23_10270 [Agrobacterium salinitolerans]